MNYFISADVIMERTVVVKVDDDGVISWISEFNPEYLAWVAEGNTPEEWNPNGNQ
jgi:hypothetical protein